ncbi:MAG: MinD/ParA family protein [Pyrinomonadaceae bacterium]
MNDQATTLRAMASPGTATQPIEISSPNTKQRRCLAITGGKGGVGKSNLSLNLALELGSLGNSVALLDADFGLANIDLLCGAVPDFHLGHVLTGLKDLDEVTIGLSDKVKLIPGGSGIEELANFSIAATPHIFAKMLAMEENLDFMLIDTAAGIAENVSGILASASEVIVVVTPEPTSIVDAYATIKLILRHSPTKPIAIVVNNIVGVGEAGQVFQSIGAAVKGFLDREIEFLGMIPHDSQVRDAIREQVPVVQFAPSSSASRAIRLIAKQLNGKIRWGTDSSEIQSFWEMLTTN